MRFIKLVVISFVVLSGLLLLLSLLLPSHVRISRATDIQAPREMIYPLVADMRNWDAWNQYIKMYHNRVLEADMMKADEVAIFITGRHDSLVTAEWHQPSGNKFGNGFALITNGTTGHSTVQWYFDFHVRWYPWEKFQSIVYDQQLGPVMERSLAALKQLAERPAH